MSWQIYVDQNLATASKTAAIIGLDGAVWAASAGFVVTAEEGKALLAGFSNPSSLANGIVVGGTRFNFTRCVDAAVIMGRKPGGSGVHCVKTNKCVIVAFYDPPVTTGQISVVVQTLGDYLVNQGF